MGKLSRKKLLAPSQRRLPEGLRPKPPSYEKEKKIPIRSIQNPPEIEMKFLQTLRDSGDSTPFYMKSYMMGSCSILVTREFGLFHLSIANPRRYPTWTEICQARYDLLPPDKTIAMILPPKHVYMNYHEFCFQMVELDDRSEWAQIGASDPISIAAAKIEGERDMREISRIMAVPILNRDAP